jgi:hypothetical protein
MAEPIPFRRPVRWTNLRSDEAEAIIREWARDTARIILTDHAFERVDERDANQLDVLTVYRALQSGAVFGDPVMNEHGHWQATMAKRMPGGRDACVVTVIVRDDRTLIVRTVMWRDLS